MSENTPPGSDGKRALTVAERAEAIRLAREINALDGETEDDGRDPKIEAALALEGLDAAAPLLGTHLLGALDDMDARARGWDTPIKTPWPALNQLLGGGLWPGLHVLTGTTGSGKTQLALQAALSAAASGTPVLYVGLELTRAEIVARVLSIFLAELNGAGSPMWSDLLLGKAPEALKRAREDAVGFLNSLPFRVEEGEAGEWSAEHLATRASAMRGWGGGRWPLIVLDYLQIVGPEAADPRADLRERIRSAALKARNVARKGATVLLLSSVSRENAKPLAPGEWHVHPTAPGKNGTPDPTALVGLGKESGEIEFSADTVLALSREEYQRPSTPMHLAVAKVRAGRPGWASLRFNGSLFSPLADAGAAPATPAKPAGKGGGFGDLA